MTQVTHGLTRAELLRRIFGEQQRQPETDKRKNHQEGAQ